MVLGERYKKLVATQGQPPIEKCKSGLVNFGTTCYINATVQCLFSITPLIDALSGTKDQVPTQSICRELVYLYNLLRLGNYPSIAPTQLKEAIDRTFPSLERGTQEDAQDFMLKMLDQVEVDLGENKGQLTQMVDGISLSKYSCELCDYKSTVPNTFRNLCVEIPNNYTTLQNCLEKHLDSETMERSCPRKKGKKCTSDQAYIVEKIAAPPTILIICLKRFDGENRKKFTPIDIPDSLDIGSFMVKPTKVMYQLCAMIKHSGTTAAGHYTAQCRDQSTPNMWNCFDDTKAWTQDNPSRNAAYILFYQKTEPVVSEKIESGDDEMIDLSQSIFDLSEASIIEVNEMPRGNSVDSLEEKEQTGKLSDQENENGEKMPTTTNCEEDGLAVRPRRDKPSQKKMINDELEQDKKKLSKGKKKEEADKKANKIDADDEEIVQITEKEADEKVICDQDMPEESKTTKEPIIEEEQQTCKKCNKPWSGFHIRCDSCKKWFHGQCVGVCEGEYGVKDEFRCNRCWCEYSKKEKAREKTLVETREQLRIAKKENEKRNQEIEKLKSKLTKEAENKEKEKLKNEEVKKRYEIKIEESKKSEEKLTDEHKKETRKLKDEIEMRRREVQNGMVKMRVIQDKKAEECDKINELERKNKQLMADIEERNSTIEKQLCEIKDIGKIVTAQKLAIECKDINGTTIKEMIGLARCQTSEAETNTEEDKSHKKIAKLNEEIRELKKEVAEYENRLDVCLSDAGLKERTNIHLNQHLYLIYFTWVLKIYLIKYKIYLKLPYSKSA